MSNGDVLIVGAGIGGLASAIALSEAGYDVTVVERQADMHSSVYGVGVIQQANMLRALDAIGCFEPCLEQGYASKQFSAFYDQEGNHVSDLPGLRIEGYPPMNGITRPRLHKILTDRALQTGATILYDTTVSGFEQFDDRVEATLTDGSTRAFEVVVGADGVRSVVRGEVLDEQWEPQYSGKSAFRINIPRLPLMDTIITQRGKAADGRDVTAGCVPLAPDLGYMYASVAWDQSERPTEDEARAIVKDNLLVNFGGLAGEIRDNHIYTDEQMVLRHEEWLCPPLPWHKGRILLIGDAVHAVTPNTAQGAAQAIEDGVVLAEALAGTDSVEAAFRNWTERRYERCRIVVETGARVRRQELDPDPDFDVAEAQRKVREALVAPI